ncbi:MAG: hypothetical protein WCC95_04545, partial [Candidatus Sulfotelmatobacter sp.]
MNGKRGQVTTTTSCPGDLYCYTLTDALSSTPVLSYKDPSTNGGSITYSYMNGSTTEPYTVNYSKYTQLTHFGCSGIAEYGPVANIYLPTSISTPTLGTYKLTYEQTPTYSSAYTTGRIASVTLPAGGSITYAYSGGSNGVNCSSGVIPTLTRTANDNNGNSSQWTYVNSDTFLWSTNPLTAINFSVVVTDPAKNQTVYDFQGQFQTQASSYQGGCLPTSVSGCNGGGTLLKTVTNCYNNNFSNCPTPAAFGLDAPPYANFTQTDVFTSYNGGPNNLVEAKFDTYGNPLEVKQYDSVLTSIAAPTVAPLSDTLNYYGQGPWSGTSCAAYTSAPGLYIRNTPCYSYTKNSAGTTVAQTKISYNAAGHPTSTAKWTSGSFWLTSSANYYTNGTVENSTDVNGTVSTPTYGDCNGLLPTAVTAAGLTTSMQWNCAGPVVTQTGDANTPTNYTNYTYNDPLWRIMSMTDPMGDLTTYKYSSQTTSETIMNFNGSTSTSDTVVTTDGLGRPILSQVKRAQGSSSFDTTQTTYGWTNGVGALTTVSTPTASAVKTQNDALGRPTT